LILVLTLLIALSHSISLYPNLLTRSRFRHNSLNQATTLIEGF
jgi:hypothetical protein